MATKIRRSFTEEFKREAVSLLTSSGRPLTQVARELGIQPSMLRHWRALGAEPPLYAPQNEPYINGDFSPTWLRDVTSSSRSSA